MLIPANVLAFTNHWKNCKIDLLVLLVILSKTEVRSGRLTCSSGAGVILPREGQVYAPTYDRCSLPLRIGTATILSNLCLKQANVTVREPGAHKEEENKIQYGKL